MRFSLDRERIDALPKELVMEELKRVAKHYEYRKFSRREFDAVAESCKGSTVLKKFGSWQTALESIGVVLKPHKVNRQKISDQELLTELGHIWSKLGHRPSKNEWEASHPKYSYTSYKSRFNGWLNACASYIEFVSGTSLKQPEVEEISGTILLPHLKIPREGKRYIPLKLRLKVLQRDKFKCVYCGKSPATHHGTVLHIDHIVSFAKGGKTKIENLQALCEKCNWGKGDTQEES